MIKLFTGSKSIDLSDYNYTVLNSVRSTDIQQLYQSVPYLFRAIDTRAKTLSSIPLRLKKGNRDVTDSPFHEQTIHTIKQLLARTEGAICLYGRAYWTKDIIKGAIQPYWLLPILVNPYYSSGKGLAYYDYYGSIDSKYGTKHIKFLPDELVRFEYQSLTSEGYWNIPTAEVAQLSAETLYNIDRFASQFFKDGAIKATVLSVEGNPTPKHQEELRTWWRSMLSGIEKAFNIAILSSKVEPVTIGDGVADLKDSDIAERREKHICAALGIPHSLVSADAANYATSQSDRLNFLNNTILPELEWILYCVNEQLLAPYSLTLEHNASSMEIYQEQEMNKAQALSTLTGKPVLTVNEARELLEREPLEEESTDVPSETVQEGSQGTEDEGMMQSTEVKLLAFTKAYRELQNNE